jgi:hypothetical protein
MNGFVRGLLVLTILGLPFAHGVSGCAQGSEIDGPATITGDDPDSGVTDDGGGTPTDDGGGNPIPGTDSGSGGGKDSGGTTKDSGGGGPCAGVVTINEIQTYGATATDEFIELYNSQPCALSLNKFALNYSSAGGSSPSAQWVGGAGDSIPANGFFLLGGAGFTPPVGGKTDGSITGGIADSGRVAILDGSGKVLDSVGYGTITNGNSPYVEKNAAPGPSHNKSIGRKPDGTDTDDNSTDFSALSSPTPGKAN